MSMMDKIKNFGIMDKVEKVLEKEVNKIVNSFKIDPDKAPESTFSVVSKLPTNADKRKHLIENKLDSRYKMHMYLVQLNLITDNKPRDISEFIDNISIVEDYKEAKSSYITIKFKFDNSSVIDIEKDLSSSIFSLSVYTYTDKKGKSFIDKTAIFENVNIVPLEWSPTNTKEDVSGYNTQTKNIVKDIDFLITDLSTINKNRYSFTFNNVTVEDVLLFLLNKLPVKDKYFIVKPIENKTVYEQITLPNYNIVKSIEYLQSNYGIYKAGIRFFFSFNNGYILDKTVNLDNIELNNKIPKKTVINYIDDENDAGSPKGSYINDDKTEGLINADNINEYKDNSKEIREKFGDKLIITKYTVEGEFQTSEYDTGFGDSGDTTPKIKNITNPSSSIYFESELLNSRNLDTFNLSLSLAYVDISLLEYVNIMSFLTTTKKLQKYNGNYFLNSKNIDLKYVDDFTESDKVWKVFNLDCKVDLTYVGQ